MIPFQFVGIAFCLALAAWGFHRLRQRQRPRWLWLLTLGAGLAGVITIWDPELTTRAAGTLGIGRGADLLTYMVTLGFLVSWIYFYQRLRALSAAVTILVRELAIRDAASAAAGPPVGNSRSALPAGKQTSEQPGQP
ncbi:hypothetical protein BH24ACI5_BH24ACI5_08030 [soil metagenome]